MAMAQSRIGLAISVPAGARPSPGDPCPGRHPDQISLSSNRRHLGTCTRDPARGPARSQSRCWALIGRVARNLLHRRQPAGSQPAPQGGAEDAGRARGRPGSTSRRSVRGAVGGHAKCPGPHRAGGGADRCAVPRQPFRKIEVMGSSGPPYMCPKTRIHIELSPLLVYNCPYTRPIARGTESTGPMRIICYIASNYTRDSSFGCPVGCRAPAQVW